MLRIAVDARPLAHPFTGIGRYTESLLERLVVTRHRWFLYSDRPVRLRFECGDKVRLTAGRLRAGTLQSQFSFSRWARRDRVDLFWSPRHHLPSLLPGWMPSVVTLHDLVWRRYPETMRRLNLALERCLTGPSLKRATLVIAVSEFTRAEFAREFPALAERCVVIPEASGVPLGSPEVPNPPAGDPYLLTVGTPEPRKNLPRVLEAFSLLRKRGGNHRLVVVGGDGWGAVALEQRIERLGLGEDVSLRGRVSDLELDALYRGAVALVFPSLYEGFGLPALEAMQRGVPVIAGRGSALPEVVGKGGLLVDPLSVEDIARAMQLLCADEALRTELRRQAVAQASGFDWDRSAAMTLDALERAARR